jgi:hypothetical protein
MGLYTGQGGVKRFARGLTTSARVVPSSLARIWSRMDLKTRRRFSLDGVDS